MIEIICYRGLGNKEMPPIEDPLISSEEMAIRRGTYEIDRQWYLIHNQRIEVPQKKTDSGGALLDGDLIYISDARFGISENKLVKKVVISGNASDVVTNIEFVSFEEFE